MKYVELFSGIGGFRKAAEILSNDTDIKFKCIAYSEIDRYSEMTYLSNYDTEQEVRMGDVTQFVGNHHKLKEMENFDLLLGGFPCQSFSLLGKRLGLSDERGKILFSIDKLLKEKTPEFVVLENVRNIMTHDKGNTLRHILSFFRENEYSYVDYVVLNAQSFGLPQKRLRIFIVCSKKTLKLQLTEDVIIENFRNIKSHSLDTYKNVLDILDKEVDDKYYLSDRIKRTILADGSKNFKSKSQIDLDIARTLTATMVKLHRACQDNYYSDDYIVNGKSHKDTPMESLFEKRIRRITPKEALKLQGFSDSFFYKAKKSGVSGHQLLKQSGNALSINTGYALLHYLFVHSRIQES